MEGVVKRVIDAVPATVTQAHGRHAEVIQEDGVVGSRPQRADADGRLRPLRRPRFVQAGGFRVRGIAGRLYYEWFERVVG